MSSLSSFRMCCMLLVAVLMLAEMTSAAPYSDYDSPAFFPDLRDLYELLLRNEASGIAPASTYSHQMERKGGRSPSLRLRFGRRADPLWQPNGPSEPNAN